MPSHAAHVVRPPVRDIRLAPEVGRALFQYDWPLNVRELGQCLGRARALAKGETRLELRHLPPEVSGVLDENSVPDVFSDGANDARLKTQLEDLLTEHQGDVAQVARSLGKARMQVYRWLKRFDLDADGYRRP